ncbi:glycosyltransferase family 2 protein [Methanobrevibacter sp.]
MSTEIPKVSIIMPTLNVKTYIEECLDSVVNQTLKDIEIILVDAGSTDGTLEILKNYESQDSRVTLLNSDKKSYGYQMNLGISEAKGEYIGIVETDDYIAPEMFERLYQLSNKGEYDLIKSNFIYVNEDTGDIFEDGNIYKKRIPTDTFFNLKDDANILIGHPSIWSSIYKSSLLQRNDVKFMEAPGGGWVDNQFFFETLCLAKTIRYTDKAYYYYRESNPDSSSNKLNDLTLPIRRMLENMDVLDKYPECKTEDVLKATYWRVNVYMDNIQGRENYEEELPVLKPYIVEMMERIYEPVFRECSSTQDIVRYFSFVSPLRNLKEGEEIKYDSKEYHELIHEIYFYKTALKQQQRKYNKLEKKNSDKYWKNRRLLKQNKELRKFKENYYSLLNSSSWKITKPLRGLFKLFK